MATLIPRNECLLALEEVARVTGGGYSGAGVNLRGVSTDTRTIGPGALFVALHGVNNDGHAYLQLAAERGAGAAIVERGRDQSALPCIEVEDPLIALGLLAKYHAARTRQAHQIASIAVGGAAGKTTTKEITAALARALFGSTLSTPGNLNNLIGVPMTLFMLTGKHHAMIIECGTNTRGEIPRLAHMVEPDVATVLNVDLEHTEGLGTLEDVADEEAALFAGARRAAVLPANDPMLTPRVPQGLRILTFGTEAGATVRLRARSSTPGGRSSITIELDPSLTAPNVEPILRTEIALIGSAPALNCAAAIAAVAAASRDPIDTPMLRSMERALMEIQAVPGRLSTVKAGGLLIIDDTYNANPRSVRAALQAAREVADNLGARLMVVLGDMLELGEFTQTAHSEAVAEVAAVKPAIFVAIGPEMDGALQRNKPGSAIQCRQFATSVEAARMIGGMVREGDVLLVKGSRGIETERVIEALGDDTR